MAEHDEARPPGAGGAGRKATSGQTWDKYTDPATDFTRLHRLVEGYSGLPSLDLQLTTCPGCGGALHRLGGLDAYILLGKAWVWIPVCADCRALSNGPEESQEERLLRVEGEAVDDFLTVVEGVR